MRLLRGYLENGEYAVMDHLGDSLNCPDSYRNLRNKCKSSLQHPYQPSCKTPHLPTLFPGFIGYSRAAHSAGQQCHLHSSCSLPKSQCHLHSSCSLPRSQCHLHSFCSQIILVSVLMKPHTTANSLGRLVTHQG